MKSHYRNFILTRLLVFSFIFLTKIAFSQTSYPDQLYVVKGADSLLFNPEANYNMTAIQDGSGIQLADDAYSGFIVMESKSSIFPYDIGLPSWNGTAPGGNGGFRVLIRVPYGNGWSPWLEVGYWKNNLWTGSKSTSFARGRIDIDTVVLYDFTDQWQFRIEMRRNSLDTPSPTITRLSYYISDDRTTQNINYTSILDDKPEPIFIPTTFLAQNSISDEYGGRICSPTSVSMILLSYDIEVDPLQFAMDTYDPYYGIFGVWPRVVQNASEFGLVGTVTRYRTWSEAWEVLANGGRIAMSIGQPLYGGHLVMLAGFNENGDPIVHDPARTYDGYSHVFNKYQLSQAWFAKGGVAYTFYPTDSSAVSSVMLAEGENFRFSEDFKLHPNFPNPFNAATTICYELKVQGFVELSIFNIRGELVTQLVADQRNPGAYRALWDGRNSYGQVVSTGAYIYRIRINNDHVKSKNLLFIK